MPTPLPRLLLEALVVAAVFLVLFFGLHAGAMHLVGDAAMTNHWYLALQLAVVAGAFHIGCEYAGVNAWYCKNRRASD